MHLPSLRNHGTSGLLGMSVFLLSLSTAAAADPDWLLDPAPYVAKVTVTEDTATLENGLVRRVIRLRNGCATIAYDNLASGERLLRAVHPEARVELDGVKYPVGGLSGQPVQNYLDPKWLAEMKPLENAFVFAAAETGQTVARFPWKKRREWMPADKAWPPPGVALVLRFRAPEGKAPGVTVAVHYELYDGIPLLSKWISVENAGAKPVRLNTFTSEIFAAVEPESSVEKNPRWEPPRLYVETDYGFGTQAAKGANAVAVNWKTDGDYGTQVNFRYQTPCLLECAPPLGPDQELQPGAAFESFRTFELALDSTERERNGLAQRRMYRTIAPWVTENPVMMHVRGADPATVRNAIDQCADVGFEMVILSFGSGFNFESREGAYQEKYKALADYARSKGVALGGYSLLSSRSAGTPAENVQGPPPPQFGRAPCLGTKWGQEYLQQIKHFTEHAGLEVFENDGSYPGDVCNATTHPFHHGLNDSQWVQWRAITDLYRWCRGQGVYLNVPDWYFLNGSSKIAMGYREKNWSLPRAQQEIIERQNIFDGTWEKTPSMGWMLVPLTEYHGGGAAATIEPLQEHLPHYECRLANLFGAGVQACYRGPRLYDAPATRNLVKKWVDFYKRHRPILDSDIMHLQRADGRDLDYLLHVNPTLKEKGLLMVYNPLGEKITRTLTIPLYYTGLTELAQIREQEGAPQKYNLNRQYQVQLSVTVPAGGCNWYVIE